MTAAIFDPPFLVVGLVIHDAEDIDDSSRVIDPADEPIAIITDIKDRAVSHLIGRAKGLLHGREAVPIGVFCEFMPSCKVSFGNG